MKTSCCNADSFALKSKVDTIILPGTQLQQKLTEYRVFVFLVINIMLDYVLHLESRNIHSKKNESCVTQDKTVYLAKAKFILARNGNSQINTVYCV